MENGLGLCPYALLLGLRPGSWPRSYLGLRTPLFCCDNVNLGFPSLLVRLEACETASDLPPGERMGRGDPKQKKLSFDTTKAPRRQHIDDTVDPGPASSATSDLPLDGAAAIIAELRAGSRLYSHDLTP
ncbi:hypothetical protein NDU88_002241 [Pleurodeles waltl]|uniref:Uncharacterized protein n=1 Tax=Pleurodeles waltl TaxID=8319 RepID=A0AAV7P9E3_PLEWA|nr:hypothetical protein NDU88_002241 [Pleurodeles waltl]